MAWISAKVGYEGTDEKSQTSQYGTRSPIISDEYRGAFDNFRESLNPSGFNNTQQRAVDWANNYQAAGGAAGRVAPVNTDLTNIRTNLGRYTSGTPNLLSANAPRATAGVATAGTATAGRANANLIEMVDPITGQIVTARQGSDLMNSYKDPYMKDVVDTSLADYDLGAAEGRNALRASNAGAFGNKRTGVAEGQFASDAAIGRGQLSATLRSNAFNTAAGYGMQDADRFLSADQSNQATRLAADVANADNLLRGRTFNAGALNDVSITNANNDTSTSVANANNQTSTSVANANNNTSVSTTNAGIQNTRDITDVNSRNTADTNAVTALAEQAGITQNVAENIFKADGIDLDVANGLFTAGTISEEQLATIVEAAREFNGSMFDQNTNTNRNTDRYYGETSASFG